MEKLIAQIQESLKTNNSFTSEEKEIYFIKLEAIKEIPDQDGLIEKSLNTLIEKPEIVKEFFAGMEQATKAYLKDGAQGLMSQLDK